MTLTRNYSSSIEEIKNDHEEDKWKYIKLKNKKKYIKIIMMESQTLGYSTNSLPNCTQFLLILSQHCTIALIPLITCRPSNYLLNLYNFWHLNWDSLIQNCATADPIIMKMALLKIAILAKVYNSVQEVEPLDQ